MNSNTYDYRTSLFAIFCRLYAHSTYKLSTRILVMDYTYKWASHYGERIPSKQLIGGQKLLSSSNQYIFIQFLEFFTFLSKSQPCAFTYQKFRNIGTKYSEHSCDFIIFLASLCKQPCPGPNTLWHFLAPTSRVFFAHTQKTYNNFILSLVFLVNFNFKIHI